ncbi:MAG: response regulator [Deltaproteobacteria bacterium]|nr:response regulator [Deltaproteobacteria bacterium]
MDEFDELLKKFDDTPAPEPEPTLGKVLVVDDDPNIQQGLKKTLTDRNYEVVIAITGQEALESLGSDVCVIILDVKLRGTDGITLYRQLKEKLPDIPIIFYSAYPGDEKVARQCLELKPYAFIEKGVDEDIDRFYGLIKKAAETFQPHSHRD